MFIPTFVYNHVSLFITSKGHRKWDIDPEITDIDDSMVRLKDMRWNSLDGEYIDVTDDTPENYIEESATEVPMQTSSKSSTPTSSRNKPLMHRSGFQQTQISSFAKSSNSKGKDQYGVSCTCSEVGEIPRVHRFQVLDALFSLFCRSNISAETLWDGGWLLHQLLPYSEAEFNSNHLHLIKGSYRNCSGCLLEESRGSWTDLLITVVCDEWRKCKRVIEASSPRKEPKCILFPLHKSSAEDQRDSSVAAGEQMCKLVKVFLLLYQLQIFSLGRPLLDQPPIHPTIDVPENSRAITAGVDVIGPKPSTELRLVDAVPCRIAFERGRERHFCFSAISLGSSGWIVLAEKLPSKSQYGVVCVVAPLAGCNGLRK